MRSSQGCDVIHRRWIAGLRHRRRADSCRQTADWQRCCRSSVQLENRHCHHYDQLLGNLLLRNHIIIIIIFKKKQTFEKPTIWNIFRIWFVVEIIFVALVFHSTHNQCYANHTHAAQQCRNQNVKSNRIGERLFTTIDIATLLLWYICRCHGNRAHSTRGCTVGDACRLTSDSWRIKFGTCTATPAAFLAQI